MANISEGDGKLIPTGKTYPETGVRVSMSHEVLDNAVGGQKLQQKKTIVHSVVPLNGGILPAGDFDLVMGSQLLRLKKLPGQSEWLVLSSPTV